MTRRRFLLDLTAASAGLVAAALWVAAPAQTRPAQPSGPPPVPPGGAPRPPDPPRPSPSPSPQPPMPGGVG